MTLPYTKRTAMGSTRPAAPDTTMTPDPLLLLDAAWEVLADDLNSAVAGAHKAIARHRPAIEAAIRAALAAQPEPLDVERLWHVLAAIGVIHSGTWVSFFHEDAVAIAAEYATLDRSAE